MKKILRNPQNPAALLSGQDVTGMKLADVSIGYDGNVYLLFSSHIPPRISGMFMDTVANAEYAAAVVIPSWESGEVIATEMIRLGKHKMNFHFIRPIPDGSYLLLGARCMYAKADGPEKNAVFVDRRGSVLRECTFGDGIGDCVVRDDGIIITGYFDEGVIGNNGWEDPIGACGLCAWKLDGEVVWRADMPVLDCYAMNLDAKGNLWYYYYTDFQLVRTDLKTKTVYDPELHGAQTLITAGHGKYLIMDGGYDDRGLYVTRIDGRRLTEREPLELTGEDGAAISGVPTAFCGARAIVRADDGSVYFADFSSMA